MNENNTLKLQDYLKPLILGTIVGTVAILVLFILFAVAMTKLHFPATVLSLFIVLAGGLGSFLSGYLSSRALGCKGLLIGLAAGLIFVVVLFIAGLACSGSMWGGQSLTKYIAILVTGALGGILGVNSKKSRR